MRVVLEKSPRVQKKWRASFPDGTHVDFGAQGYSDYTIHGDPRRMRRYVDRHARGGETWTKDGLRTPGFWARWLLWSRPSIEEASRFMEKKFGLEITRRSSSRSY